MTIFYIFIDSSTIMTRNSIAHVDCMYIHCTHVADTKVLDVIAYETRTRMPMLLTNSLAKVNNQGSWVRIRHSPKMSAQPLPTHLQHTHSRKIASSISITGTGPTDARCNTIGCEVRGTVKNQTPEAPKLNDNTQN